MNCKELIERTKLYLLDMDGTIYLDGRLYDFTVEFLEAIKKMGGRYIFMTNNSSRSVADYQKKLACMGIKTEYSDFMTSAQATVYYLKKHHPGAALYVCGTQSLKNELISSGFLVTDELDKVECIVMGFDTELTFKKIDDVCRMLSTRDLPYIATNPDVLCPTEYGGVPDCGSVCDMVYNSTQKRPVVIGKPHALMPRLAMEAAGVRRENTAVIGDRIYTDVKSGINSGAISVFVLSGEGTMQDLEASDVKPDLVLKDCGEILKEINAILLEK